LRWPDLRQTLAGIPWAVCGAVATRLYMPERATADLEVVILTRDAPAVHARLLADGYGRQNALAIGGSTWQSPDGRDVDVLEFTDPWVADALAEAAENPDPQGLPVLPLRYLVLRKLAASRAQDIADLARMLGVADEQELDRVRATIREFSPSDIDDLEALIRLGQLEKHAEHSEP
jgi:hypothetical protein